ncbi:MAG: response regulator [Spirochaetes bacterium]|nr:response regulator [Spirochaetota bacterium]
MEFEIPDAVETSATTLLNPPVKIDSEFASRYPLKLLVAEDDVVNQVVITESLRVLGYRATMAENGKEALEWVAREHFDLILMDVQMPEVSGIAATERIRKMPNGKKLIIIALTADSSVENQRRCFDAGMDDFLMKPFNLAALQNALMKWSQKPRQD